MIGENVREQKIIEYIINDIKNIGYIISEYRKVVVSSGQKEVYFINIDNSEYVLKIVNVTPNIAIESILENEDMGPIIKEEVERLSKRTVKEIKMGKECNNLPQLKILDDFKIIEINSMYYLYYIEEKIEGESLKYKKEYSFFEIIDFIYQMVEAIIHMTQKGYVHRDIKPDNIIVNNGKYFLIDGGICKNIFEDEQLTVIGSPIGTKRYRAPEQEKVLPNMSWTFQTDLYPLGLIAIEMFIKESRGLKREELKDLHIVKDIWLSKDNSEISEYIFKKVIVSLSNPIKALRFNDLEKLKELLLKIREDVK